MLRIVRSKSEGQVAQHRAHEAERYDRHDDDGPAEIGEHPGEHDVDREKADDRAREHVGGRFGLLLRLSLEPVAQAETVRDIGQPAFLYRREQGAEAGDRFVDLAGDRDFARPVLTAEAGEAALLAQGDDFTERHFGAVGRAQEEVEERGAVGAAARVAHLDLDLLVAAREALGDGALERVPHLHPGALRREAERPAARRDLQDQLLLAVGEIVVDGAYGRESAGAGS